MPHAVQDVDGIGARIATFLRARYPQHRAKTLARTFSVSISTAQRWLDGYPPTIHHFEEMYAVWGEPLIRAVFPECFHGTHRQPDTRGSSVPANMPEMVAEQSEWGSPAVSVGERD